MPPGKAAGLLERSGGKLQHLISDAATMQIIRWTDGGFGMAVSPSYRSCLRRSVNFYLLARPLNFSPRCWSATIAAPHPETPSCSLLPLCFPESFTLRLLVLALPREFR